VPQRLGDAEDRRARLVVAVQHDHLVEDGTRGSEYALEKQPGLGTAHAPGAAADQDVAVHGSTVRYHPRVPAPVSVIIPTLNEQAWIGAAIESAFAAGAAEVIVADGGSSDDTLAISRGRGATVIETERMRARQLNRGAEAASHETLIFLHADTQLPAGAAAAVARALDGGFVFGGFRVSFVEPGLEYVARLINARTRMTRAPWGDQAQFLRRGAFPRFREIPIMEDYELARRMKRAGRTTVLPLAVRTSGRRFLEKGAFRTAALNWWIIASYHLGVPPERLARWYRGT
jgi:rSAM/selenodomain-associated transferase 2